MIACPKCSRTFDYRGLGVHARFCGLTSEDLFWSKVQKGDGCWLFWRIDKLGYGRFDRKGPYVFAHRAAWLYTRGEIPAGMDVCHTCDVRRCCNPAHLFLGTAQDNMDDCKAKDRHSRGERNNRNTLTEEQVLEILRNPPARGKSGRGGYRGEIMEYAKRYGVTYGAIYCIVTRRSWLHLQRDGDSRT